MSISLCFLLLSRVLALAAPTNNPVDLGNTVTLSYGSFQGGSSLGLDTFLGIPFAQAERFGLPQTPAHISTVQNATAFGPACPQQSISLPPKLVPPQSFPPPITRTSEDCLFVNVIRPSQLPANSKLPVLFWLYGGGFEVGDTSLFDGSQIVNRSIASGQPVIYVSANYRLNAFGFLGSKEIKEAGLGNLGLRDQRFALKWVHDNIALFGGDPSKVTIWGESAGAISVGLHMVLNGGETGGLFQGAFMQSGSPLPFSDISSGQIFYDQLVEATNCTTAEDTLACLKTAPLEAIQNMVDNTPSVFSFEAPNLVWRPRVDGSFLAENPWESISKNAYAKIPMVTGDCDDEGTLFSFTQLNITTEQEGTDYLHKIYAPSASNEQFKPVADLYPSDPAQGSPFDTGTANQLTPQFKRLAAFQGDALFQASRRFFMRSASKTQPTWSFLYKRGKATPLLGAFHTNDIAEFYAFSPTSDFQGTDALINFANHLDPNPGHSATNANLSTLIPWPEYSTNATDPPLLTFLDTNNLSISPDTYREAPIMALEKLYTEIPF